MNSKIYGFTILLYVTIFSQGIYSPFSNFNPSEALAIEPEYFSVILAGSSILFGFWLLLIKNEGKSSTEKVIYTISVEGLFLSLSFLGVSVIALAFTAVDLFAPEVALISITSSFIIQIILLGQPLYHKLKAQQNNNN